MTYDVKAISSKQNNDNAQSEGLDRVFRMKKKKKRKDRNRLKKWKKK